MKEKAVRFRVWDPMDCIVLPHVRHSLTYGVSLIARASACIKMALLGLSLFGDLLLELTRVSSNEMQLNGVTVRLPSSRV